MASYSNLPDDQLLQLLKESDHSAYNEIYRRYFYLIFSHAYKKLRDEEQAKDVVQDVFTSLWLRRDSGLPAVNLSAYLFTAVRYKVFDLFRREQSAAKYVDAMNDFLVMHASAPSDHLIREKQLQAYIDREVEALPAKMKLVFRLSRQEGLSRGEIAERLQISESNVSKNLSLALKILKAKLGVVLLIWWYWR